MTKRKRLVVIVIMVAMALCVGAYQYLHWLTPVGAFMTYFLKGEREILGTVRVMDLEVPGSDRSIDYVVYLPPGYDTTGEQYPTIYHLHGAIPFDREKTLEFIRKDVNWTAHALEVAVSDGLVQPSLIVAPYDGVGTSMWSDSKDGAIRAESDVVRVLIPYIDSNYRTLAERSHRAARGFSMGGVRSREDGPQIPGAVLRGGSL